jgi:hypothetical protein
VHTYGVAAALVLVLFGLPVSGAVCLMRCPVTAGAGSAQGEAGVARQADPVSCHDPAGSRDGASLRASAADCRALHLAVRDVPLPPAAVRSDSLAAPLSQPAGPQVEPFLVAASSSVLNAGPPIPGPSARSPFVLRI